MADKDLYQWAGDDRLRCELVGIVYLMAKRPVFDRSAGFTLKNGDGETLGHGQTGEEAIVSAITVYMRKATWEWHEQRAILEAAAKADSAVREWADRNGRAKTDLLSLQTAIATCRPHSGLGSALILDNLGIVLDQAKAEAIYAESLGITASELTALQREEAFQKAAKIEISRLGPQDGLATLEAAPC